MNPFYKKKNLPTTNKVLQISSRNVEVLEGADDKGQLIPKFSFGCHRFDQNINKFHLEFLP